MRWDVARDSILHGIALGKHLLAAHTGDVVEQLLSLSRITAGLQHTATRHTDECAGILIAKIVQLYVGAIGARLSSIPIPVVVINDAAFDLATVRGAHDGAITSVDASVRLEAVQPLTGF